MSTNPTDLIAELKNVPLSTLLELLRTIEKNNGRGVTTDDASTPNQPSEHTYFPFGPMSPLWPPLIPDLHQVVRALSTLHTSINNSLTGTDHSAYDRLHQRFREFEKQQRKQQLLVDKLLNNVNTGRGNGVATGGTGLQQTIFVQCPRGGRSGGRFRVVNRNNSRARASIRMGDFFGDQARQIDDALLTFAPSDTTLEPDEAATFTATVDLSKCGEIAGGELHTAADVLLDTQPVLKLWVQIEVYDESSQ